MENPKEVSAFSVFCKGKKHLSKKQKKIKQHLDLGNKQKTLNIKSKNIVKASNNTEKILHFTDDKDESPKRLNKRIKKNFSKLMKPKIIENSSSSNETIPNKKIKKKKSKKLNISNTLANENNETISDVPTSPTQTEISNGSSIDKGKELLQKILGVVSLERFFKHFWEKTPFLIQRNDPKFFENLLSFQAIENMLLENHVEYTSNIDVTRYNNDMRYTLNPEGRAIPAHVWNFYEEGCSIRLLNPQGFIKPIFLMNTTLQEFFHCMVGANVYLTPPNSQGFAPHFDDIEAFVLQIEGRKRWKLYNPRSSDEVLPRYSSSNLKQEEIGEPIFDEVLYPGDVLYFPRGTIHQANTEPGFHSLHITLSVYQKQTYADLFEILIPKTLSTLNKELVEMRVGLPINVWENVGMIHTNLQSQQRFNFLEKCKYLVQKLVDYLHIDEAIDQMAKKFQHDALPPFITNSEKQHTIFGKQTEFDSTGKIKRKYNLNDDTRIRLLRANILRLLEEDGNYRVYYYLDNTKSYREHEANYIDVDLECVSFIKQLIEEYPKYMAIKEINSTNNENNIDIAENLWERGLIMTEDTC